MSGIAVHRWLLLLMLVVAVGTSCSHRDPPPDILAANLRDQYRQCDHLVVDLMIYVIQPERETLTFSLQAWAPAGDVIRVNLRKMNVAFLDGRIDPDGGFTAVIHQEQKVVVGTLADLDRALAGDSGGTFFTHLATIIADYREGPVPVATDWGTGEDPERPADEGQRWLLGSTTDGGSTRLYLDAADTVLAKALANQDGVWLDLEYRKEDVLDDHLRRARIITLRVPGVNGRTVLKTRRLDAVPTIDPRDLELTVPVDWQRMTAADFVTLLVR